MKHRIGAIAFVTAALLAAACGRKKELEPGESRTTAATVTANRETERVAPPAPPPPTPSPDDPTKQAAAPGAPIAPRAAEVAAPAGVELVGVVAGAGVADPPA